MEYILLATKFVRNIEVQFLEKRVDKKGQLKESYRESRKIWNQEAAKTFGFRV